MPKELNLGNFLMADDYEREENHGEKNPGKKEIPFIASKIRWWLFRERKFRSSSEWRNLNPRAFHLRQFLRSRTC
jgi:hypothetical protein